MHLVGRLFSKVVVDTQSRVWCTLAGKLSEHLGELRLEAESLKRSV